MLRLGAAACTRPRGPQEMAVLCRWRWLLLAPGTCWGDSGHLEDVLLPGTGPLPSLQVPAPLPPHGLGMGWNHPSVHSAGTGQGCRNVPVSILLVSGSHLGTAVTQDYPQTPNLPASKDAVAVPSCGHTQGWWHCCGPHTSASSPRPGSQSCEALTAGEQHNHARAECQHRGAARVSLALVQYHTEQPPPHS